MGVSFSFICVPLAAAQQSFDVFAPATMAEFIEALDASTRNRVTGELSSAELDVPMDVLSEPVSEEVLEALARRHPSAKRFDFQSMNVSGIFDFLGELDFTENGDQAPSLTLSVFDGDIVA